ncbi:hypothetical protein M0802_016439 [Mischocyttarus mexicanus]|nr:hypothetical protein M0802_016439 [Mischocyttarus mexicanus]
MGVWNIKSRFMLTSNKSRFEILRGKVQRINIKTDDGGGDGGGGCEAPPSSPPPPPNSQNCNAKNKSLSSRTKLKGKLFSKRYLLN